MLFLDLDMMSITIFFIGFFVFKECFEDTRSVSKGLDKIQTGISNVRLLAKFINLEGLCGKEFSIISSCS